MSDAGLVVDPAQIEQFVKANFLRVPKGGCVSLRAFPEKKDGEKVNGKVPPSISPHMFYDLAGLTKDAVGIAQEVAGDPVPRVFCPPIAVFKTAKNAEEANVALGPVLSVELDKNPQAARKLLEAILGEPTCVVESGGLWTDPKTGEIQQRLHLHLRLRVPASSRDDLKQLRAARDIATEIVGGDSTGTPISHCFRWPGSWHRKGEPRLCRIASLNMEREIDISQALEALRAASGGGSAGSGNGTTWEADESAPSLDGLPDDIVDLIRNGAEPGTRSEKFFKVCAVMRRAGFTRGKIITTLGAFREGIAARCFERGFDDLPRHVRLCLDKIDAEEAAKRTSSASTKGSTKGKRANYSTVRAELRSDPRFAGFVAFNAFAQAIQLRRPILGAADEDGFDPRPWRDEDATDLAVVLNDAGFHKLPIGIVHALVATEARVTTFHPVREFLTAFVWDGKHRLGRLFFDHCGVEAETPEQIAYVEAVTRCFFISAVARVIRPGCKADCMVVLEGKQGILKSKLLRAFAIKNEWFSDSLPHDLATKDAKHHLSGKWIIEMSELSQFRGGASIETLKSYLTCQEDKFRPPYGRNEVNVPRQCVFAGTTNSKTYLHDPTGQRRFWPLRLANIKLKAILPIVPQIWAEAVAAFNAGEQWWLTPKLEKIAAEVQDARRGRDPWEANIASFVGSQCPGIWFSTGEIFEKLGLKQELRNKGHEMRVAEVLTELGCEHVRKRTGGKLRPWGWQMPIPLPAEGEQDDA